MPQRTFSQTVEVPVPTSVVHDHLLDMHDHTDHPLIQTVEDLPSPEGRPHVRRYRVTDRIKVGPFPLKISYVGELEDRSPTEIRAEAFQRPAVHLSTIYSIAPSATGGSLVTETCTVKAPALLLPVTAKKAEAAHRESFASMRERFEASSDSA